MQPVTSNHDLITKIIFPIADFFDNAISLDTTNSMLNADPYA